MTDGTMRYSTQWVIEQCKRAEMAERRVAVLEAQVNEARAIMQNCRSAHPETEARKRAWLAGENQPTEESRRSDV